MTNLNAGARQRAAAALRQRCTARLREAASHTSPCCHQPADAHALTTNRATHGASMRACAAGALLRPWRVVQFAMRSPTESRAGCCRCRAADVTQQAMWRDGHAAAMCSVSWLLAAAPHSLFEKRGLIRARSPLLASRAAAGGARLAAAAAPQGGQPLRLLGFLRPRRAAHGGCAPLLRERGGSDVAMPVPALTERSRVRPQNNATAFVAAREAALPSARALTRRVEEHYFASAVPALLKERELSYVYAGAGAPLPDKVFALAWLDDSSLLLGTKCNRLLRVCVAGSSALPSRPVLDIALPARPPPSRAAAARRAAVAAAAALFGLAPAHGSDRPQRDSCGIHALAVSPGGTYVATGGAHPSDVALLHGATLTRAALCLGHSDWIFGLTWLSDDLVASGSRDGRVLLWSARGAARADAAAPGSAAPLASRARHAQGAKVRALALAPSPRRLASLGTDGTVLLWDPAGGLAAAASITLPHDEDLVCLAGAACASAPHAALLAAGSLRHVALADARCGRAVGSAPSQDGGAGVRSLSLRGHVLTVGGAAGRLSFLDLRTRRYLDHLPAPGSGGSGGTAPRRAPSERAPALRACVEPPSPRRGGGAAHLCAGPGRFYSEAEAAAAAVRTGGAADAAAAAAAAAEAFAASMAELGLTQAVYAHAWDATGGRLAAAGGPLLCGARGCYTAIWAP